MSKISFNNKQSPFFDSLKEKVDEYFEVNKIKHYENKLITRCALAL